MPDELRQPGDASPPRPWYWRFSLSVGRIALASYTALIVLLLSLESRMVYHPPPPRDAAQEAQAMGAEEVWFAAEDGTRLHGWFFPAGESRRAVIYYHGNGEDAERNLDWGAELRDRLRAAVLIFDYRGYGHSEGKAHEAGLVMDGLAAQRWIAERLKLNADDVLLYGRSLGGGVAVAAAAQLGAKAVIVENTFADMSAVGAARYPFVPVRWLMRNSYHSQQRIADYNGPFLQFHGTEDVVVPIDLARPLCESAPSSNKRFVEIPGGGHNDALPEFCWQIIAEFVGSLRW